MMQATHNQSGFTKKFVLLVLGSLCIVTCVTYFARYWWIFELTSHFRVQYFLLLLGGSIFLFLRFHYKWAMVAAFFSILNLATVVPLWTEVHADSSPVRLDAKSYRALLFNVNHGSHNYQELLAYIDSMDPDFIILLEVNERWMNNLQGASAAFPYKKGMPHEEYGILLLSKTPFNHASIHYFDKEKIPSIVAQYTVEGDVKFMLLGTHPRSPMTQNNAQRRNEHLVDLGKFVSRHHLPVMVLGDLNTTPWSPAFHDLLIHSGLRSPTEGLVWQPTWPTLFPFAWIPIDHCLVSPGVFVHQKKIGPNLGSDHYPLIIDFSIGAETKPLSLASALSNKVRRHISSSFF